MIKKASALRFFLSLIVSLFLASWCVRPAQAQGQEQTAAGRQRPLPPIMLALDASQDGVVDAMEIANAGVTLKTLDQNGDGKLTPDEYRPLRPDRPSPRDDGQDPNGREPIGGDVSQADGQKNQGQVRTQDSSRRRPRPPVDLALDENGDEVIDAGEIAKAPALLKKLDLDNDGRLSRNECSPKPSVRQDGQGELSSETSR